MRCAIAAARQPTSVISPSSLCVTTDGGRENHIWYIDTTHMRAKDRPITAPESITTQAKGWYSLVKYQELISSVRVKNGTATTVHLNHIGRT